MIHVLDVATRKELIEPIDRAHYSYASWLPDDSGFFYLRQRLLAKGAPETEKYKHQTAFFHRLKGSGADRAIIDAGTTTHLAIAAEEFPYRRADRRLALDGRDPGQRRAERASTSTPRRRPRSSRRPS